MGLFSISQPKRIPKLDRMKNHIQPEFKEYLNEVGGVLVKETRKNLSGKVLNKRSGRLYNSIHSDVSSSPGAWKLIVGNTSDVRYAAVHEKGLRVRTRSGSSFKMPKRPYLWRAYQDTKQRIKEMLRGFVHKVTR